MSNSNDIYFRARKTVLKMMTDRGYVVPDALFDITNQEFDILFEKKEMNLMGITDNKNIPVYVKMIEPSRQFNKAADRTSVFKEVAKYFQTIIPEINDDRDIEKILDNGQIRLIIIYNAKQSGQIQTKYEEEYITHPYIEVFRVDKISVNPTEHKNQPKFRLITDQEEIKKIYDRYMGKPFIFPSICINDPINRYYGGRPAESDNSNQNIKYADLYEIDRHGCNISYRKVINKKINT